MKLSSILRSVEVRNQVSFGDMEIASIAYHSGRVEPGSLFVAIPGEKNDGHLFIEEAEKRGAAAVVTERAVACGIPQIQVPDSRAAMARMAHNFFNRPSEKMRIVGITGTNGKTTSSFLLERILIEAGKKTGVIGTINYRFDGKKYDNPVTTPESLDLQSILHEMIECRVDHAVMEVSSHAIALKRIACCWMDIGIFTNLSQDHLDFHMDMASYWKCKKSFFTEHLLTGPKKSQAVINCFNPRGKELAELLSIPVIKIGDDGLCQIRLVDSEIRIDGIRARVDTPAGNLEFTSDMIGKHNLENILCAVGAALSLGIPADPIKRGIQKTESVPGRLERVPNNRGLFIFVDYAHTPDALYNVLSTLKGLASGRIITVFGCGGDRDRLKRPAMGKIAEELSDIVIITSDNPRSEDPEKIIQEILSGIDQGNRSSSKRVAAEVDRRKAIRMALDNAKKNDVVLVAGKGHENYQLIGKKKIDFSDAEVIRTLLLKADKNAD